MDGRQQVERDVVWADPYFQQLSINIISNSSGILILELPRSVIDSKMPDNVTDSSLVGFFRQGTFTSPAVVHELNGTEDNRVVSIDFPVLGRDSIYNLGIQGTYVMPEFGGWATAALALSLVSVLFLSIKFNTMLHKKTTSKG